ncbi:hypothetical protein B0H19DRAFT_346312 [Mycena capillaripes]|nr:hypothetical protein B0H19DRAFT_346312 [Mycena capillaripes]
MQNNKRSSHRHLPHHTACSDTLQKGTHAATRSNSRIRLRLRASAGGRDRGRRVGAMNLIVPIQIHPILFILQSLVRIPSIQFLVAEMLLLFLWCSAISGYIAKVSIKVDRK